MDGDRECKKRMLKSIYGYYYFETEELCLLEDDNREKVIRRGNKSMTSYSGFKRLQSLLKG